MAKTKNCIGTLDKTLTFQQLAPAAGVTTVGPFQFGGVSGSVLADLFPGGTVCDGRLQVVFCVAADAALVKAAADAQRVGIDVTFFEDDGVTIRGTSAGFYTAANGDGLPNFSPEVQFPDDLKVGIVSIDVTVPTTASALSEFRIAWKPDCSD